MVDHYADHARHQFLLVSMFVISGIGLATFLGGAMRRLTASDRPGVGLHRLPRRRRHPDPLLRAAGCEQALSVVAHGDHPDLGAVAALWALHNSVFTVLLLFIGIALFGLSRAGVAAGITPRVFGWLGPVGIGHARRLVRSPDRPSPPAKPVPPVGLAVLGFVIWLAFLVTTGLRLVAHPARQRGDQHRRPPSPTRHGADEIATACRADRRAWNRADGDGLSDSFADDADFVDIRGVHHVGRAGHRRRPPAIFDTIYAGQHRPLRARVGPRDHAGRVVAVVRRPSRLRAARCRGINHARFTLTIAEGDEGWPIDAFHNTLFPSAH